MGRGNGFKPRTVRVRISGEGLEVKMKLIKFQANWCGPCHAVTPIVKKIAAEYNLDIEVVDIDTQPDVAQRYGVSSIPAIILEAGGVEVGRSIGAAPKSVIEKNLGLE